MADEGKIVIVPARWGEYAEGPHGSPLWQEDKFVLITEEDFARLLLTHENDSGCFKEMADKIIATLQANPTFVQVSSDGTQVENMSLGKVSDGRREVRDRILGLVRYICDGMIWLSRPEAAWAPSRNPDGTAENSYRNRGTK